MNTVSATCPRTNHKITAIEHESGDGGHQRTDRLTTKWDPNYWQLQRDTSVKLQWLIWRRVRLSSGWMAPRRVYDTCSRYLYIFGYCRSQSLSSEEESSPATHKTKLLNRRKRPRLQNNWGRQSQTNITLISHILEFQGKGIHWWKCHFIIKLISWEVLCK